MRIVPFAAAFFFLAVLVPLLPAQSPASAPMFRLEDYRGKTVLLFTPHPDDDAFCCAGTVAQLVAQGTNVHVMIYTNDDKGSYDLEMTSERLARIRKAEEEEGNRIIGVPKENLHWLGHHDGMLEYADSKFLVEQATEMIRRYRPALVMSVDPGSEYVRWHKTDHRMAGMNTLDAIRAAEWHLYFPNHRLQLGLEPYAVPAYLFFYVTDRDANTWVNIDSTLEKKLNAGLAHVSQFEPAIRHYRSTWEPGDRTKAQAEVMQLVRHKDGHAVEAFRFATEFNQY